MTICANWRNEARRNLELAKKLGAIEPEQPSQAIQTLNDILKY